MSPSALPDPADKAPTAFAGAAMRLKRRALRTVLIVSAVCLGIALILTVLDRGGFGIKLIYSFSVGATCIAIVFLALLAMGWLTDLLRAARGLPLTDGAGLTSGWRPMLPGALGAAFLGPPVGLWLADRITGLRSPSVLDFSSTSTRLTIVFSLIATVLTFVTLVTLERLASARAQAEAAQRQSAEHQLRLLQSQLEPHMLFNTLANLRVLIGLEPERAQAMLDRLINFLRATLNASRLAAHPLATEFERIEDYLALMGVRMGARLQVTLELPAALRALPVPPLLLQPLVENAVKHGLEPHVQGGRIHVAARLEGGTLVLSVRDTGSGLPGTPGSAPGSQFGLAQVRERLTTLHGTQASLRLEAASDDQGGTLATIRMPVPYPVTAS